MNTWPTRRPTGAPRNARVAVFIRTMRNWSSSTCSPTGDWANNGCRIARSWSDTACPAPRTSQSTDEPVSTGLTSSEPMPSKPTRRRTASAAVSCTRKATDRPTASSGDHPNIAWACGLHSITRPLSSTRMSTPPPSMETPPQHPCPGLRSAGPPAVSSHRSAQHGPLPGQPHAPPGHRHSPSRATVPLGKRARGPHVRARTTANGRGPREGPGLPPERSHRHPVGTVTS